MKYTDEDINKLLQRLEESAASLLTMSKLQFDALAFHFKEHIKHR